MPSQPFCCPRNTPSRARFSDAHPGGYRSRAGLFSILTRRSASSAVSWHTRRGGRFARCTRTRWHASLWLAGGSSHPRTFDPQAGVPRWSLRIDSTAPASRGSWRACELDAKTWRPPPPAPRKPPLRPPPRPPPPPPPPPAPHLPPPPTPPTAPPAPDHRAAAPPVAPSPPPAPPPRPHPPPPTPPTPPHSLPHPPTAGRREGYSMQVIRCIQTPAQRGEHGRRRLTFLNNHMRWRAIGVIAGVDSPDWRAVLSRSASAFPCSEFRLRFVLLRHEGAQYRRLRGISGFAWGRYGFLDHKRLWRCMGPENIRPRRRQRTGPSANALNCRNH